MSSLKVNALLFVGGPFCDLPSEIGPPFRPAEFLVAFRVDHLFYTEIAFSAG